MKMIPDAAAWQRVRTNATFALLATLPASREVAARTVSASHGLAIGTLRRWLDQQHDAKAVHIARWEGKVPIFAFGPGEDAERPAATTRCSKAAPLDCDQATRESARQAADAAAKFGCAWSAQFYGRVPAPECRT